MQSYVHRGLTWLFRVEVVIACTAFVLVAVALFADVLGRELFGNGIFGAQRFAVYCTAIAGLLGFTIVVHSGGHLRVGAVDRMFPAAWHPVMTRVGDVISAVICLGLGVYAFEFVQNSYRLGETGMAIQIKLWPIQSVIPYIFFASALRYLAFAAFPAIRPEEKEGE